MLEIVGHSFIFQEVETYFLICFKRSILTYVGVSMNITTHYDTILYKSILIRTMEVYRRRNFTFLI